MRTSSPGSKILSVIKENIDILRPATAILIGRLCQFSYVYSRNFPRNHPFAHVSLRVVLQGMRKTSPNTVISSRATFFYCWLISRINCNLELSVVDQYAAELQRRGYEHCRPRPTSLITFHTR